MKKTVKNLVALLFCLSMVFALCLTASAASVGTVKPKATVTYNSVTLTWSKVSGADGYEVYVASGSSWKLLATTNSKTYTYTHKNLTTGTTYKYRVRAYDKGLLKTTYGSYSSTVSAKPALSKVTGLKASSITTTSFKLTWTKVSGATGYRIERYSNGKWVKVTSTKTNSYSNTKANLATTYKYRILAYRLVNKKYVYSSASATLSVKCAVPAPTSLKCSAKTINSLTLSWTAAKGATGYRVEIYKSGKWTKLKSLTATKYTVTGLTNSTSYSFRICAYTKYGSKYYYSSYTSTLKATTSAVPAPTTFKCTSATTTTAVLSWKAASGATGYRVEIYKNGVWTKLKSLTATTYTLTGLTAGTDYSVRVCTYIKSGSKYYYSTYATLAVRTAPAQIPTFTISDVKDTTVLISWSAIQGAQYYVVYQYNTANKAWDRLTVTSATQYTVTKLSPATEYTFTVRPYHNKNGFNCYGTTAASKKVTTYFDVVEGFKATATSSEFFTLEWTAISGTYYTLENYDYTTNEWEVVSGKEQTTATKHYFGTKTGVFEATVTAGSDYATKVSWPAQPSSAKYIVQVRSASASWQDVATTTSTSATIYLAPNTQHEIRVLAYNGQYRVKATKSDNETLVTAYEYVSGTLGGSSSIVSYQTAKEAAYNSSSTASKTAYMLKLVQAINNTKHETDKVTVTSDYSYTSTIAECTATSNNILFNAILKTMDLKSEIAKEGDFDEQSSETYVFENGVATSEKGTAFLNNVLTPSARDAYLYDQNSISTIAKRVTSLTVTTSGDITKIVATLPQEVSTNGSATPIHDGLMDGFANAYADMKNAFGNDATINSTVGATTITAEITSDNMLKSLTIKSPLVIDLKATMDLSDEEADMNLTINLSTKMNCNVEYNYTFTR